MIGKLLKYSALQVLLKRNAQTLVSEISCIITGS